MGSSDLNLCVHNSLYMFTSIRMVFSGLLKDEINVLRVLSSSPAPPAVMIKAKGGASGHQVDIIQLDDEGMSLFRDTQYNHVYVCTGLISKMSSLVGHK